MGIALTALLAIALCSDIPISLQIFAVGASIYGFFELHKWTKKFRFMEAIDMIPNFGLIMLSVLLAIGVGVIVAIFDNKKKK